MAVPSVMVLPMFVVVMAGIYYVYNEVTRFMSKSVVRNKVVVITDAVSGMGSECARLLHKGGARLVLCGPSWDKLESLYDSLCIGSDPTQTFTPKLVLLDFSDTAGMQDSAADVIECYGCVDIMICNSSMKIKAPVQDLSLEMDRNIMDMNYFGPVTLVKGVLPSMISRRTGHFLLVNSIQGRLSIPFRTSYAASKHAVQAFFDCLRAEVEEYGISVSTISHTYINSSQNATEPSSSSSSSSPSPSPASSSASSAPSKISNSLLAYLYRQLNHGVTPHDLANEIVRTVDWKRREVLLAHPIPQLALCVRCLLPSAFFSVVAAGVKDGPMAEQMIK
ncbi:dehydrogenase/reductase (SDR family) member 7Cb [Sardina pilchardus]|uniref:dehydrogenase/reductase (SDR family) member 7Cb n=1 Tax=Sardina pilchardus TaxID=27697 RepID=UPI002E0E9DD5